MTCAVFSYYQKVVVAPFGGWRAAETRYFLIEVGSRNVKHPYRPPEARTSLTPDE